MKKVKTNDIPKAWLYLTDREVTAEQIAEALSADVPDLEIWKDAQIIEIPIGEKASMDMEKTECPFGDPYSDEFLDANHIKTAYVVDLLPECYDRAAELMKKVILACGGFFCGDTDDFTPQVK